MSKWCHTAIYLIPIAVSATALLVGCEPTSTAIDVDVATVPDDDKIRQELDDVLELTFERRLSMQVNAAWQILHGALAYKREFQVEHKGNLISAVDHILEGGRMKGWTTERGDHYDEAGDRYGLRAIVEEGTKAGQGHSDQWLAVLAQCDLGPEQEIVIEGDAYSMTDFVRQVQLDIPRNRIQEYSWTLIGLTTYLNTEAEWTAFDGSKWSIPRLVEIEATHDVGDGACGGTHRLIGLSMALNQHIASDGKIEGPWAQADERIKEAIKRAREYQNADGSFSTNYLARGGTSPDLAQNLGTTGHVLEFLTISLTNEQLQEPWVKRAVMNLCELFRKTKSIELECGALYHAAHGLVLYRERVFGPRTWLPDKGDESEKSEDKQSA